MTDYITYCRVSTGRQQQSGLGIEAQQEAVHRYASQTNSTIIAAYIETESGAKSDRPQLAKALAHCRRAKATLLIARLDRLSRSLSFVAQLLDANVEIRCADMPEANRLLLQMLAVFSEHERQMIRERTRAALAAAKARGTVLGANGKVLAAKHRTEAQAHAEGLRRAIMQARAAGCVSLPQIADFLTAQGHQTASGGRWHPMTVRRVLDRLNAA
jgi:DNA invertase Pin-like site-specific DNA recombinase